MGRTTSPLEYRKNYTSRWYAFRRIRTILSLLLQIWIGLAYRLPIVQLVTISKTSTFAHNSSWYAMATRFSMNLMTIQANPKRSFYFRSIRHLYFPLFSNLQSLHIIRITLWMCTVHIPEVPYFNYQTHLCLTDSNFRPGQNSIEERGFL